MADTAQTFETVDDFMTNRAEEREAAQEPAEVTVEPTEEIAERAVAEEAPETEEEISETDPVEEDVAEASDEDSEGGENEELQPAPVQPAAEAPQHLKGEQREQFSKLPPEAQLIVADLAKNGEAVTTRKAQELSQTRQLFEQRMEGIDDFISETETQQKAYANVNWENEFALCETQEDINNVTMHKAKAEGLERKLNEAKKKRAEGEAAELHTHVTEQYGILSQMASDNPIASALVDKKDGPKRRKELKTYLTEQGVDDATLTWIPASGLVLAYKAMQYDKANKKATELPSKRTQKAPAPKVVRSASNAAAGSSDSKRLKQLNAKSELSEAEFIEKRRLSRSKRK